MRGLLRRKRLKLQGALMEKPQRQLPHQKALKKSSQTLGGHMADLKQPT
jgi:hypothetical protein